MICLVGHLIQLLARLSYFNCAKNLYYNCNNNNNYNDNTKIHNTTTKQTIPNVRKMENIKHQRRSDGGGGQRGQRGQRDTHGKSYAMFDQAIFVYKRNCMEEYEKMVFIRCVSIYFSIHIFTSGTSSYGWNPLDSIAVTLERKIL